MKNILFLLLLIYLAALFGGCDVTLPSSIVHTSLPSSAAHTSLPRPTPKPQISYSQYEAVDKLIKNHHYHQALSKAEQALLIDAQDEQMLKKASEAHLLATRLDQGPASKEHIVDRMKVTEDLVAEVRWHEHKYAPESRIGIGTGIRPYIGQLIKSPKHAQIRLTLQVEQRSAMFPRSLIIAADEHRFRWNDLFFKNNYELNDSREWIDLPADDKELLMINAVIASKKAIIRFSGDKHYVDYTVTAMDRIILQDILTAYRLIRHP